MKLSTKQQEIWSRMEPGVWHSAYGLGCSLATLRALAHKKAAKSKSGLGACFSPRNDVKFQRIEDVARLVH